MAAIKKTKHKEPRRRGQEPDKGFIARKLLGGTLNHYGNELRAKTRLLSSFFFKKYFDRIMIEPDRVEKLRHFAARGRLIYALPYRSPLDFLFLHHRLRYEGLPTPEILYNTDFYRFQPLSTILRVALARAIHVFKRRSWPDPFMNKYYLRRYEEGAGFVLNLEDPASFARRLVYPTRDPLYHLLKLQRKREEPIIIVPIFPVFDKSPERTGGRTMAEIFLGPKDRPGRLRKISHYLRHSRQAFVGVGDPVTIGRFVERPDQKGLTDEQVAFNLRKELWGHARREQKVIRGPAQKPRTQLMEWVLRSPDTLKVMRQESKAAGKPFRWVRKRAAKIADEIAANYSQSTIEFLDVTLGWVWRTRYSGVLVDQEGLDRVREAAKRHPLIYVPSHKSHIDYLVLSWVLYNNNMVPPHIVAGVNLNTWPIGGMFRKAGAFFMRRSFKDDKLYSIVFRKYIEVLIREGYNIEFFIEGGRSRTGRLMLPTMGMVKFIIEAFDNGASEDIKFVPIYIGYDQIIEEHEYLEEMHGVKSPKGNLVEMVRNVNLIKRQYGRIYVNFAEPISLRDHLRSMREKLGEDDEESRRIIVTELSEDIVQGINRNQVVTPFAILAAALLASPAKAIGRDELLNALALYYQYLMDANALFAETLDNVTKAMEDTIDFYARRKLIEVESGEEDAAMDELAEPIYTLPEDKRLSLEMYKNMILHHFLPMTFISMSLLSAEYSECSETKLKEDYRFLDDLLSLEFIHDEQTTDEQKMDMCLSFLERGRQITVRGDRHNRVFEVTTKGREEMVYFAAMLTNFLEAYGIVLNTLPSLQKKPLNEKDLLTRLRKTGQRLYKQGTVLRPEALSQLLFKNAVKYSINSGILIPEKGEGKYPLLVFNESADDHRKHMLTIISRFIRVEKYHYLEK